MKQLSNHEIVELLKEAKKFYINFKSRIGMCCAISNAYYIIYNDSIDYTDIKYIIPKFNTKFLNITFNSFDYWWPIYDNKSRIGAFNKLITYYKHNSIFYKIKFYFKLYYYKFIKIIKQL